MTCVGRVPVALLLLAACSGSARCEPVSASLLSPIEQGLTVTGGGSLRDGYAVRSDDFSRVWFVAAEIDGSDIGGDGEIGVWATNSPPDGSDPGLIFAVNALAQEFSDWGADVPQQFSITDDGASEAEGCV